MFRRAHFYQRRKAIEFCVREATIDAGITRFEIAFFGATAGSHDSITQVPRSFGRTLDGLKCLLALKREHDFAIELRLLVSRQTCQQNPAIVRMIMQCAPGIDAISLNRLILSTDAADSDAAISWEDARTSVNESANLIRELGCELLFGAVPLCVFEGENATFVRRALTRAVAQGGALAELTIWRTRYLDPMNSVEHDADRRLRVRT